MSTRGTVHYDQPADQDWSPVSKPWCADCCSATCGCGELVFIGEHVVLGEN